MLGSVLSSLNDDELSGEAKMLEATESVPFEKKRRINIARRTLLVELRPLPDSQP